MQTYQPDHLSETWLCCLGLSRKAARAVMAVHLSEVRDALCKSTQSSSEMPSSSLPGSSSGTPSPIGETVAERHEIEAAAREAENRVQFADEQP